MAGPQKTPVALNFANGMDQKNDPKSLPFGKFLMLVNRVFNKEGLLEKRNGFGQITTLSNATSLTTFNSGLVTIGANALQAFSPSAGLAINAGFFQPLSLSTMPVVRSATSQTTCDMVTAPNGLACATWLDSDGNSYYQIVDTEDGQIVVPKVALPATATCSRVFILGQYFVVTFLATVAGTAHLQFVAIPYNNLSSPTAATDIATDPSSIGAAYDAFVANNLLYVAWNRSATIALRTINTTLQLTAPISIASNTANLLSMTVDTSGASPIVWVTWWNTSGSVIKTSAYDSNLSSTPLLAPTVVASSIVINEITSTATGNVMNVFYEVANAYSFTPNAKTDFLAKNTCTLSGTAGTASTILRNAGLGSKAIYSKSQSKNFMLASYGQTYQPTYYLIDDSGRVLSKFAYSNGAGYALNQVLPNMMISGSEISVSYLFKDLVQAVNKAQNAAAINGIYANLGINLATITLGGQTQSVEIANGLHTNGGFVWQYDGVKPVEHSFFVWPEDIQGTWSTTGGSVHAQPDGTTNTNAYFYQVTYEWTDAQGIVQKSAPSVPLAITTTGSGTTGSVTLNLPTLRQTYKTTNKVRIVVYRWSVAQQNYFQVTSVASPLLNDPTSDAITFTDTFSDSQIIGNALIYTTGGVLEDIAAPSANAITLFDDRAWILNAEDGTLWYTKQVLPTTPLEWSDQLTVYLAPSIGSAGPTGLAKCIFPMDDKMIVFKENALYYFNGTGPNIMGTQNQYSEPIFIPSSVGCSNQASIVMTPKGLMFQSKNGIWRLNRDLTTEYIGKEVQDYNSQTVTSTSVPPGTTQVRFTLSGGTALMYDHYYDQWCTFSNIRALASTLYQGLHTYLDPYGRILQETPGKYLDVSTPVVTGFETAWINLGAINGYIRLYSFYLLGEYISPHKLFVGISYDYRVDISQQVEIDPLNFSGVFGEDGVYGTGDYGGIDPGLNWEIFPQEQKCNAFKLTVNEIYDPSFGGVAGAGLTLSGINMMVGVKRGSKPLPVRQTAG